MQGEIKIRWSTDICLKCSEEEVKAIFKKYPDVKEAFAGSVRKMREELEKNER